MLKLYQFYHASRLNIDGVVETILTDHLYQTTFKYLRHTSMLKIVHKEELPLLS